MQKNVTKLGYRKTKIGWIPEEWECSPLGAVCRVTSGGTPSRKEPIYWGGNIPWVTTGLINGNVIEKTEEHITEEGAKNSAAKVFPAGTILMAMYGQGKTRGKVAMLGIDATTNQACAAILESIRVHSPFLLSYLHSRYKRIREVGNASTQKNLNGSLIKTILVPLPPLPEQEAIAGVLECWDRGIENLELKIVKKRNIKKGLMQALLSGKIRLPGFGTTRSKLRIENSECGIPEGWKEVQLGELGETYSGLTGKSRDDFGAGKPFIPYMNIYSNALIDSDAFGHVAIKPGEHQNRSQYGDLFFTTSSETPEEVGTSSILLHDVDELYLNSFCFGFRLHDFETLSPEFSRHYFRGVGFRKAMFRIAQGASRYNLSKKYFLQTHIQIPEDIEEQKEIARVLSAQDSEIGTLECKLAVLKDQKRFLLNNLVTGSLRLPEFRIKNSELGIGEDYE